MVTDWKRKRLIFSTPVPRYCNRFSISPFNLFFVSHSSLTSPSLSHIHPLNVADMKIAIYKHTTFVYGILSIPQKRSKACIVTVRYETFSFTNKLISELTNLKALSVNDGRTRLVILSLGDPHLLEGGQGGEDGTSDPDRVLSFRGSDNLDLHGGGSKSG